MEQKIKKLFDNIKSCALFFHVTPDADAIGSALCLYHYLKSKNVEVSVFSQDEIDEKFDFLSARKIIKTSLTNQIFDLGIVVDCPDVKRIGTMINVLKNCNQILNIDHHLNNSNFADFKYINEKASSTCEIIYTLFEKLKIDFDDYMLKALYAGLSTDTGCFMYNLNPKIYKIASKMCTKINLLEINNLMFRDKSINVFKLFERGFSKIELLLDNFLALVVLTRQDLLDCGVNLDNTAELMYYLCGIKEAKIVVMMCESGNNEFKVSFRSKTEDVFRFANAFGGGGQKYASGCKIFGTKNSARNKLINKVKELI